MLYLNPIAEIIRVQISFLKSQSDKKNSSRAYICTTKSPCSQNAVQLGGKVDQGPQVHVDQPQVGAGVGVLTVRQQIASLLNYQCTCKCHCVKLNTLLLGSSNGFVDQSTQVFLQRYCICSNFC